MTAPTGQYDPNKLLNLGSDRWSFKPELAISKPFGPDQRWVLDAYANTYLYTDNASYRGAQVLRQQALLGLEGHISYTFNSILWASLDHPLLFPRQHRCQRHQSPGQFATKFHRRQRAGRLTKLPKLIHHRIC